MDRYRILVGTYTDTDSEGIYAFDLEDGKPSQARLFAKIDSPKYISTANGLVASIGKFDKGCGVAVFDSEGALVDAIAFEERTSCYVTWHNGAIYTANYHLGTFSRILVEDGMLSLDRTVSVKEGAGCHQVLFQGERIFVPALFLDRILVFDSSLAYQGSIQFPDGTGPRHGVFTEDGKTLYVLSELSNELFELDAETLKLRHVMPVLPDGSTHVRGSAAIRLSNDEKLIYTSTRRKDTISVIDGEKKRILQGAYSGGKHPRDFILAGNTLLSANRYSDIVIAYKLKEDGTIGSELGRVAVPQPVNLAIL